MTDLHDLLDLSTNRIEAPDLVAGALAGARRRRTTRAGVFAGGLAAALVAGVIVVTQLGGSGPEGSGPITPPSVAPTTEALPTAPVTQSPWKPRNVAELSATADIAPVLPDVVEPPAVSPWLADDPVEAAVLAFWTEDSVSMLAVDGSWRSVPLEGDYHGVDLTRDGTRLVIPTRTGADVWDLPTGEMTRVDQPAGFVAVDDIYGGWRWVDDETLLLAGLSDGGGWLVDVAGGEVTQVPYPSSPMYWSVDDAGAVIEGPSDFETAQFVDWATGQPRRIDLALDEHLSTPMRANADTIATTRSYSVVILDRDDLSTRYELPFVDNNSNLVDGRMSVVALLADGTVLLQVPVYDELPDEFSWRLVSWTPGTGDIGVVSSGTGSVPQAYAVGLLG
jgi:hypothetical protein